ncbi:MAG TPA: antibiotic biosynthesis monooxygenase family protein [Candidatus Acidoferrales bacterium]|nr:antibiotic biosynthesis monooxygenase family protein [Candidatus Acidoferrales bacterium]
MVRVLVFATVKPENGEAFEAAFAEVSARVRGTPGHVTDELLRDPGRPGNYILLSQWMSKDAFLAWEMDPIHRATTTPMRPYWVTVERRIFEVAVAIASP